MNIFIVSLDNRRISLMTGSYYIYYVHWSNDRAASHIPNLELNRLYKDHARFKSFSKYVNEIIYVLVIIE